MTYLIGGCANGFTVPAVMIEKSKFLIIIYVSIKNEAKVTAFCQILLPLFFHTSKL